MFQNKSLFLLVNIVLLTLTHHATSKSSGVDKREFRQKDVTGFERSFHDTLDYKSDSSMKLIGFVHISIPTEELEIVEGHYFDLCTKWNVSHIYLDKPKSAMRVYFPVHGALVEHGDIVHEASPVGELDLLSTSPESLSILGRKQTGNIRGVKGHNIIKDGIIYLSQKKTPSHCLDKNIVVFDFGEKVLDNHPHHHGQKRNENGPVVNCMDNHGGPNCSDKFNIHFGRCPFVKTWCMDYNGWITDCQKVFGDEYNPLVGVPKVVKLIGSDCGEALNQGKCWNEFM